MEAGSPVPGIILRRLNILRNASLCELQRVYLHTPSLYGIAYCCWATNAYNMLKAERNLRPELQLICLQLEWYNFQSAGPITAALTSSVCSSQLKHFMLRQLCNIYIQNGLEGRISKAEKCSEEWKCKKTAMEYRAAVNDGVTSSPYKPRRPGEEADVQLYSSSNLGARWGLVVNATPRPL